MPITALDIILVLIMILSGLLAMLRGLTREMLSLMAWALAALVTLLIYTHFRADVRAVIDTPMLADALLIGIVFIASLIGFSLGIENAAGHLLDKKAGKLDSMLAFPYGLVRGLVIVTIIYLVTGEIVQRPNLPGWILQARSLYLIEYTGDTMKSLMPDNPDWLFRRNGRPFTPPG
jgi:membrane protein required for colicin V production